MSLRDIEITLLDGTAQRFGDVAPGAAVIVNVASQCGFTPQYQGLEALHQEFASQGLVILGMPCNQFLKQEPGTAEEISEFCKINYGVTFPLLAKGKVNGRNAHELFKELKHAKDASRVAGPVLWNFEKFVIGGGAAPSMVRFRSATTPEDPALRAAVTAALAS